MTGYRIIPIHPNFKKLLSRYLDKRKGITNPHTELFLTKRGTSFSESTIIHLIANLQRDLDFSFSCHDFRRAFVTRLYRKTKDLVLCQRLAGHASINTTRKYILDDIQEHMRKFNGINF
ncbi:MAG: site-specific integrase [Candidatus Heimdallarchaeota archaeon]|nr:site-specific integrase [Candidatus Heimdallarchaeota archaeon]